MKSTIIRLLFVEVRLRFGGWDGDCLVPDDQKHRVYRQEPVSGKSVPAYYELYCLGAVESGQDIQDAIERSKDMGTTNRYYIGTVKLTPAQLVQTVLVGNEPMGMSELASISEEDIAELEKIANKR